MQRENLYSVLGVTYSSTPEAIKAAYRSLAKLYHPDINPNDERSEELFKKVQYAYDVLSDVKKRREYDLKYSPYTPPKPSSNSNIPYNGDSYRYAQQFFREDNNPNETETQVTKQPNSFKVEARQIVISIIIAILLLYFIISY